ncbi:MAG: acetyl/propionyl/methylcrotonyl-CoA carboxylase subunit alpha [Alphaproteobacteria bacterium]
MVDRLLIANRGEIACRIIRTARRMGIETLAVYSEADGHAAHVALADSALAIGPAPAAESYLRGEALIEAAQCSGAQAIHPGYGFLSENAAFAEAVAAAGLIFVGPPPAAIRAMGLKDQAKALMEKAGVPIVPGYHGANQDPAHLVDAAHAVGFPVLIKAVAGGGGKGMRRVDRREDFEAALASAKRESANAFGDDRVLIERFVTRPRHVEIQVFADAHGGVVHLFERDCSLQRRHQKVIEEAPAPGMTEPVRTAMGRAAVEAARAIGYRGAGTVEFIADGSQGLRENGFFFMEMNTRLQVEHPVTEMITGLDLVEWQIRVAMGEPLPRTQEQIPLTGHAIEARLYAENPSKGFLPSTGTLHRLALPEPDDRLRIDTGVRQGDAVTIHYDPMIAKIIAWGETRDAALRRLGQALRASEVAGVQTNAGFLAEIAGHPAFRDAAIDTGFIDRHLEDLIPDPGPPADDIKALAALYVLAERDAAAAHARARSADPHSPWHALDGWRVGARAREVLRFGGDHPFTVTVGHGAPLRALDIDGRMFEGQASMVEAERLSVVLNGRHDCIGVLRLGRRIVIMTEGHAHEVVLEDPLERSVSDTDAAARIAAPMPGKIIAVHAAEGDSVRRGQALVVLEAMKMEHTLSAGADGTVESLTVAPGDQVEEGAVLATLSVGS